jgi:hypothetical protein
MSPAEFAVAHPAHVLNTSGVQFGFTPSMDIFLKLLGGIALTIVLLIAGFILWFRWKMRTIAKGLAGGVLPPSTIDLTPDPDPTWSKKSNVQRDLAALESCGFTRGPAYTVDGMPGVSLIALHHAATGAHGCCYDHAVAGNWTDLCVNFTDGIELTVSNAPQGSELDTRPGTEKVFLPGKTVTELHSVLTERLAGRAVKGVGLVDFKAEFIAAYARDVAWRGSKEGTSEAEFLRIAANHKKSFTDEQLKEAFKETKLEELRHWADEAIEAFEKSTALSVAEWKRFENEMIIFRPSFHPHAYLEYLTDTISLEEEAATKYRQALDAGLTLEELLARVAADTGHEFVRLGEVEQPKKVQIYGVKTPPDNEAG